MAVLSPPFERIETTAGVAVSGGKLRVYDINTTTLSSLYSDEAMATPLTNPVVADSNGILPMIFAAEGTYDIACLTAASVAISGAAYTDYPTIGGSSANTITRTLSGARVKIDGGDIGDGTTGVRIQAGNPSPDDTGGYWRLGGWGATQADKGIIDAAAVDFLQTKSLKEGGKRISSVLYTDATTVTATTPVDIALPNTPSGTREWLVELWDWVASASDSMALRFSYDSASTYKSGASDYAYAIHHLNPGTATPTVITDDAHTMIRASVAAQNTAAWYSRIALRITTVNSGNGPTLVTGSHCGARIDVSGAAVYVPSHELITGVGLGNYGRATHLRILGLTGTPNYTGFYRVTAVRGTGE